MIEVRNLTKRFGQTVAVNDVSFDVPQGEVVGFLGPNGAGKTTTMRVVTCYLPPDAGTVKVSGYDSFDNPVEVRRRIGYLPESAPLYLDMGVVEYLQFVAGMRGLPPADHGRRIREMVEVCGLGPMLQKDIGQLSKGFRQRVGLAATLMHNPEVLVLDEPTTGLDPNQIIEIRELIKEIGREKTIILSTHILQEVEATCTRVLIINDGRIVASGTTDELTRMAAGKSTVQVTMKAPAHLVEPKLRAIEGVEAIRQLDVRGADGRGVDGRSAGNGDTGISRYEVVSPSDGRIEEKLFRTAVDNGWVMTELHTSVLSLEQVFLQLTMGEKRS